MTELERFLEWVDNSISTYEDAPIEVKNGYISIPFSMLKELRELVDKQQREIDLLVEDNYDLRIESGNI